MAGNNDSVSATRDIVTGTQTKQGESIVVASNSSLAEMERLYKELDRDVGQLDYLPSDDEVDAFFEDPEETKTRGHTKKRNRKSINKLTFGTIKESQRPQEQVFIYMRAPSFNHKEPCMTFFKQSAEVKHQEMSSKDLVSACARGTFTPNDLWLPLVVNKVKIHLEEIRCVLKVFLVRRGIKLSKPIPMYGVEFRKTLVAACMMFKEHGITKFKEPKMMMDSSVSNPVQSRFSVVSIIRRPGLATTDISLKQEAVSSSLTSPELVEPSYSVGTTGTPTAAAFFRRSTTLETPMPVVQPACTQFTADPHSRSFTSVNEVAAKPTGNEQKQVLREQTTTPFNDHPPIGYYNAGVLSTTSVLPETPSLSSILRKLIEPVSASRTARDALSNEIKQKTSKLEEHATTVKRLEQKVKDLDNDYTLKKAELTALLHREKEGIKAVTMDIEARRHACEEKTAGEKRRVSQLYADFEPVRQLAEELEMELGNSMDYVGGSSKRQKPN